MRLKKHPLLLLSLLFLAPTSYGGEKKQETISFLGTWVATSEAIYLETGSTTNSAAWEHPKMLESQSMIKITGQERHRFWGIRIIDNQKPQPFIAVIDPSESTIVAVDQNGSIRGKVVNKNIFSYCYTQEPSKTNNQAYVECTVARRQLK